MSPRRDRVVKVRVSEAELAGWQERAKESFEGNLSDAIRSAMSPGTVRVGIGISNPISTGAAVFTSGTSTARYVPGGDFVTVGGERAVVTAVAGFGSPGPAADPDDVCPHGRLRESQWCPVCDG